MMGGTGCPNCLREVRSSTHPENDRHYSVEWGAGWILTIYKGDEQINDVSEVMTGPGGWAIRYPMPPRRCLCGSAQVVRYRDASDDWRVEGPEKAMAYPARLREALAGPPVDEGGDPAVEGGVGGVGRQSP